MRDGFDKLNGTCIITLVNMASDKEGTAMSSTTNTMYNTTDNRYEGDDTAMQAAQALADYLRAKLSLKREADMQGETWDRIFESEERWLNEITVHSNFDGAPAVGFEGADNDWAFELPLGILEKLGYEGYYCEPYYSFLVNIYSTNN